MTAKGNPFDRAIEGLTRQVAQRTSRRSFLTRLAATIAGGMTVPLLPVDRTIFVRTARASEFAATAQTTDPTQCNYWRYCAHDGYSCSCCGGGPATCPPGSHPAPTSWVGSCINPDDGRTSLIAYRDCCGKDSCARCACLGLEGEMQIYRPQLNNDIVWCFGAARSPARWPCRSRHPRTPARARTSTPRPAPPATFEPFTADEVASHRAPAATPSQMRGEREALIEKLQRESRLPRLVPVIAGTEEDYSRQCQGCHRADGMGGPGAVPRLRAFVGWFTHLPEGRDCLARVPNVVYAPIDDQRLADVLNWMLATFSPDELAPDFAPYTPEEVAAARAQPVQTVKSTRRRLVAELQAAGIVPVDDDGLEPRPY